ncbi:H-NS histone family protein [Burkholderia sp. SIMBA_043]|uniref:H-NS histone family protein n=1 Tax=Burkholderia TaxID=32008 RepID=UPI0005D8D7D8|nr:H-NS histone family protein [Burkholderia vietnamiensis]AJY03094.1 H-NS histone family protein [Burkholderia vietnamiensis LMG 10929]AVR13982.1 H-NS histone family protein [Burkholderia vietnamiensis]KVM41713.1 hypothetical protein WJ57_29655 [Burkholderia vietnamiensis]KVS03821.1 hypothetical protein WK30_10635 [Burkholderia vietnamiensis]UBI29210.1 H-NS histone family protein [Burkholderia vietnamiensis]
MTKNYRELLAERAALDKQIATARSQEREGALTTIRQLMADFAIKVGELAGKREKKSRAPVEAKYRDPASGKMWSGRGKPPAWIAGKDRGAYLIVQE